MIFVYVGGGKRGIVLSALLLAVSYPDLRSWLWGIAFGPDDPFGALLAQSRPSSVDDKSVSHVTFWAWVGTTILVGSVATLCLLYREGRGQGFAAGLRSCIQWLQRSLGIGQQRRGARAGRHVHWCSDNPDKRFEEVVQAIQRLPLEVYLTREDLEQLPTRDLKARLVEQGLAKPGEVLDKCTAIDTLLSAGGTSSGVCAICCEDYKSEDSLRVLRCGHRFHLACVDQWFLTSSYTNPEVACPFCNAPLLRS